jgi:beta-glucosidase
VLPLDPAKMHSLVLIGGHADVGVLTGGGSAQVDPPGASVVPPPPPGPDFLSMFLRPAWLPSSPLRAFKAQFPAAKVSYVAGDKLDQAASAAKGADAAIVFAYVWESEGFDLKTLDLPDEQNKLIEAVAAANPRTIVVLETGSPATMPWVDKVAGVIEAWYPGIRGAEALANTVSGKVNPSGKLAITFPTSDADLPHPKPVMPPPESEPKFPGPGGDFSEFMKIMAKGLPPFQVYYDEKLKVGYKWYDAEKKPVLFPFGFGLSYTTFAYSGLSVSGEDAPTVAFTVKNTGLRAGTEIAQVYSSLPKAAGEPPKRLIGWRRIELGPGESKQIVVPVSRARLSIYDEGSDSWKLVAGSYTVLVGSTSQELPLHKEITLR